MIRQYFAQRFQGGTNPLRVGVVATGSIFYLQDKGFFCDDHGGPAICRTPWIVEAFLNGRCCAARRDPVTGVGWTPFSAAGRTWPWFARCATVAASRSAVRILQLHDDLGLSKEPTRYPSLPDLHFYRRQARAEPTPMQRAT